MSARRPPLLLLGSQRSGTTALAYALSEAFAAAGGLFTVNGKLPYLLARWLTDADLAHRHLRADEILHALHRRPPDGVGTPAWLGRVEEGLRTAAAEIAEHGGSDALSLARRLLAHAYAPWPSWGDKYNEYLLDLPHLDALVPDARYLMLVRHPHETAASTLAWGGDRPWRPSSTAAAVAKWNAWHDGWLRLSARLPPGRALVIEYRSLCAGRDTARLSELVGLDLAPYFSRLAPRHEPPAAAAPLPAPVAATWNALLAQCCR